MRDVTVILGIIIAVISVVAGTARSPLRHGDEGEVGRWIIGLGTAVGLSIAGLAISLWPDDTSSDLVVVDQLLSTSDSESEGSEPQDDESTEPIDNESTTTSRAVTENPGVPLGTLALDDTAVRCESLTTETVLGATYTDVWGCNSTQYAYETAAEFNLAAKYETFTGFVAVTDTSPANTITRATITVDGTEVYNGDLTVGDQIPLELDITNATRIQLSTKTVQGDHGADLIIEGLVSR